MLPNFLLAAIRPPLTRPLIERQRCEVVGYETTQRATRLYRRASLPIGENSMITKDIDVFLSCSFSAGDAALNELVKGVCKGLHVTCVNVGAGYSSVPPEKAREYISSAEGLVAVATVRDRLDNGEFIMPAAVREEIAIAYGLGKPILIVGESGVRFDGFMNNYCTRLPFVREDMTRPAFIEKLVHTLFTFRQEIVGAKTAAPSYASEYFSESTGYMVSLECDGEDYLWTVANKKRLRFEAPLERDIVSIVWPAVQSSVADNAGLPEWEVTIDAASRQFEVQPVVRDIRADRLELALRFQPDPQPGDMIEFTRTFKSRRLNPLTIRDLPTGAAPAIVIGGRGYPVRDGVLITERVHKLHAHYSFPEQYGLRPESVAAFVGSYGYTLEYLAPWELARLSVDIDSFGKKLLIDLRADNPVPRYLYGVAWLPPT
jgi:hypothetical protein